MIIDNSYLEKLIYLNNSVKSYLPKWKREQLDQDEYMFFLSNHVNGNDDSFYLITDKSLYKNSGNENIEIPINKIIRCTSISGQINVGYSFDVTFFGGKINFKLYRKANLIPFRKSLVAAINYHNDHNIDIGILDVKKALKNPENNYYVCHHCGKKVAKNEVQRIGGCKSCKKYNIDEIKAGMKILEMDKGIIEFSYLQEYCIQNDLTLEQVWNNKNPIMMKWLNSKKIESFLDFQKYVEEVKIKNQLDKDQQDWRNKIPGTEKFEYWYEYENYLKDLRKHSHSKLIPSGSRNVQDIDFAIMGLIFIPTLFIGFLVWPAIFNYIFHPKYIYSSEFFPISILLSCTVTFVVYYLTVKQLNKPIK